jgi:hypothetical protein
MFTRLSPHLSRAVVTLITLIRDNTDSLSSHQVRDVNFQFIPALIRNQGNFLKLIFMFLFIDLK